MKTATAFWPPVGLIQEGKKLLTPECFQGEHDGKSIKEFIAALEIYSHLAGLKIDNTRALFSKKHLTKLAKIWCNVQRYADGTV